MAIESHNPATGALIWSGEPGDAAAEVAAARAAYPAWAARPLSERVEAVRGFADVVREREGEFQEARDDGAAEIEPEQAHPGTVVGEELTEHRTLSLAAVWRQGGTGRLPSSYPGAATPVEAAPEPEGGSGGGRLGRTAHRTIRSLRRALTGS